MSTDGEDIPGPALAAYQRAASVMAETAAACKLPWTLLAAIGRVESDHGRYDGAVLGADGVSRPHILGVALDGSGGLAKIRDTDGGRFDGDDIWDRAVGPMQFIPPTWALAGVDGDADGARDPHDLDDAALAAGVYLCADGGDLSRPADQRTAVFRYNHSPPYVTLVLAYEQRYRTGLFTLGGVPVVPNAGLAAGERLAPSGAISKAGSDRSAVTITRTARPGRRHEPSATLAAAQMADRTATPDAPTEPAGPSPASEPGFEPVPAPAPAPEPTDPEPADPGPADPEGDLPELVTLSGVWTACETGLCIDETPLLVGDPELLDQPAAADYDADGVNETFADELTGLLGRTVTLVVDQQETVWTVYAIDGVDYLVEVTTTS